MFALGIDSLLQGCSVIANLLLLAAHILETIVIHEHEHITVLHNLHDLPFRFFGLYRFRRAGVSLRLPQAPARLGV